MKILSIIPARGGSKRIPKKNLLPLNGIPLVGHTISHSLKSKMINKTVVTTDDQEIIDFVAGYESVEIVKRPSIMSNDNSPSEEAIKHTLDYLKEKKYTPDIVVFMQATSPIRPPGTIDDAINLFIRKKADSLLSVTKNHNFIWIRSGDRCEPLNYNYENRPMTQCINNQFIENGSFYIFKPWVIIQKNNRLGGNIELFEMNYWSSIEIDDPEDFELCDYFLNKYGNDCFNTNL